MKLPFKSYFRVRKIGSKYYGEFLDQGSWKLPDQLEFSREWLTWYACHYSYENKGYNTVLDALKNLVNFMESGTLDKEKNDRRAYNRAETISKFKTLEEVKEMIKELEDV